jgi:transglutaminase/protease-like cytokinesis protein 3
MPREVETSPESVAKYIAEREPDQMQRVKALHDWVADRVAYDVPAYLANRIPEGDYDARTVFRTRLAVCGGYADLLALLGKITGDEILYVAGDARSSQSPMEGEGHAWNAARIGGAWYLMDATWDAGGLVLSGFEKSYQTGFLFTPPDQFAITHFPDQAKWQLLETPVSRVDFFRRPVLSPVFFANGLELLEPDRSQVSAGASVDFRLSNPRGVFLLVSYTPKRGGLRTWCDGNKHTVMRCDFTSASSYDVRLFVNANESGSYAYAGSVEVNARP